MEKQKYKIIFIDIDGTLVNDEKQVSQRTINKIKKLKEKGIITVLTSGRPYGSIEKYSIQCDAMPYLIGSNGAITRNIEKDEDFFIKNLEKQKVLEILKIIRKHNLYTTITVSGNIITDTQKYGLIPEYRPEIIETESLEEYIDKIERPIIKFSIVDEEKEKLENIRKELIDKFDITMTPVDIMGLTQKQRKVKNGYISNPYITDIMAPNTTKGDAIRNLSKYLKIDLSQTIAIGDGRNDIEMFETVGYKIAMKNAVKELYERADIITTTNNNEGVADALEKIFEL